MKERELVKRWEPGRQLIARDRGIHVKSRKGVAIGHLGWRWTGPVRLGGELGSHSSTSHALDFGNGLLLPSRLRGEDGTYQWRRLDLGIWQRLLMSTRVRLPRVNL